MPGFVPEAAGAPDAVLIERFEGGPFVQNTYLAWCEEARTAVIVDPGAGIGEALAKISEEKLDVQAILLTHAHLDHVDGLPQAHAAFPDLPIWLHSADQGLYDAAPMQAQAFGMPVPDLPPVTDRFEVGSQMSFGGSLVFDVRYAPGHAPGHVILVAFDAGAALVGDVVFQGSIGRTDLPGGDLGTLMRSIRDQVLTLPDGMVLHSGHGPETTVQRERVSNPFLNGSYSRFA